MKKILLLIIVFPVSVFVFINAGESTGKSPNSSEETTPAIKPIGTY
jgi:hypothetical protein